MVILRGPVRCAGHVAVNREVSTETLLGLPAWQSLAEKDRIFPRLKSSSEFIDRGSTSLGPGTGPQYGVLTSRRCVATPQHSIKAHGALFVTPFPSFRPTELAMRVCPRTFGGRIWAGRSALLGHYHNDCLCAISPRQNIAIAASHELDLGEITITC